MTTKQGFAPVLVARVLLWPQMMKEAGPVAHEAREVHPERLIEAIWAEVKL